MNALDSHSSPVFSSSHNPTIQTLYCKKQTSLQHEQQQGTTLTTAGNCATPLLPPRRESDTLSPGNAITTVETPFGVIGVGICYDIRFPELSMAMRAAGSVILCFPGAFNMTTGPAHWELLQRARALDNQVHRPISYETLHAIAKRSASAGVLVLGYSDGVRLKLLLVVSHSCCNLCTKQFCFWQHPLQIAVIAHNGHWPHAKPVYFSFASFGKGVAVGILVGNSVFFLFS